MHEIELLNIKIDSLSTDELLEKVSELVSRDSKALVSHVNIHGMNFANKLPWYKDFLNRADINFCDGDGVRMGAKILGSKIKEKITYNRFIWDLAEYCSRNRYSVYFIGSKQITIKKAVMVLAAKYPSLEIKGFKSGFFTKSELDEIITDTNDKKPDILIIGMGMPVQEKFIKDNFEDLSFKVVMPAGAVFEYVAGTAKMTPDIYYKLKLEWFYRLTSDPKRLWKRYLVGNLVFMIRIFKSYVFD